MTIGHTTFNNTTIIVSIGQATFNSTTIIVLSIMSSNHSLKISHELHQNEVKQNGMGKKVNEKLDKVFQIKHNLTLYIL